MRNELILIFRFFCLDKNLIVNLLKGPGGSIAKEGSAKFSEASVHTILTQALTTVQDWLRELHVHHSEVIDQRKTSARLELETAQLSDKNRSLLKSSSLLRDSLERMGQLNEALLEPIKFELSLLQKL